MKVTVRVKNPTEKRIETPSLSLDAGESIEIEKEFVRTAAVYAALRNLTLSGFQAVVISAEGNWLNF